MQILYHANCPDGFGAALATWLKFGDTATYNPVFHNEPPPEIISKEIIISDFCYPYETMLELSQHADKITVIDHHQGMQAVLNKLKENEKFNIIFDEEHSGAVLTWKYFNPGKDIPKLLTFIEDRDCHFNRIKDAIPALLWLDTQPFIFPLWRTFLNFDDKIWEKIINYNEPMVKKFNSMIRKAANQSVKTTLAGWPAAACFGTEEIASDIAIHLSEKVQGIGIVFVLQSNGSIKASIRTTQEINLVPIAQKLGGNGHPYAAAFPCDHEKLSLTLKGVDLIQQLNSTSTLKM